MLSFFIADVVPQNGVTVQTSLNRYQSGIRYGRPEREAYGNPGITVLH